MGLFFCCITPISHWEKLAWVYIASLQSSSLYIRKKDASPLYVVRWNQGLKKKAKIFFL